MPLIAAIATLCSEPERAARALGALSADPAFTLGERHGQVQALVFESDTRRADRVLDQRLASLDGVIHVDVISAFYDELLEEEP